MEENKNHISKMAKEKIKKFKDDAHKQWLIDKKDFIAKNDSNLVNYFNGVPPRYQKLFHGCFVGKYKGAKALKAKCLDCSVYDTKEIKNCTVRTCPLWNSRPYQEKK